ncbi:TetR/AcrR family transcriptional regulator [Novosphingobium sp. ZW T3_23]|uniref:TetR/AcrR family transcriptional regulator n=1 Tax=Novosphingobium sp. ZW T3_23 TaxID=3378084 RepID=UPI003853AF3C
MNGNLAGFRKDAPTDARQVRSRKALNAAMLCLLEEKTFDQITIRDISARAGTGYATFFRHYPTKEALLGDVASEEIAGLLALSIPLLHAANSYESTLALCTYVGQHRALWSALLAGGAAGIVRDEFIRQARGLIEGVANPTMSPAQWLPQDLGVVHGTGSTIDILAWWLAKGQDQNAEDIARILHRLVIAPLVGDSVAPR